MDNRTSLATILDYAHTHYYYSLSPSENRRAPLTLNEEKNTLFCLYSFVSYLDQIIKFVQIENKERYNNDVLDHDVNSDTIRKANE